MMEATTPIKTPPFPDGPHGRAALRMLLKGEPCDQIQYHLNTGYPIADFRTRVSELTQGGWPILRAFHWTRDVNGHPYKCKTYWLDFQTLEAMFTADSVFRQRCQMLREGA